MRVTTNRMNWKSIAPSFVLLTLAAQCFTASAVCLERQTGISGYRLPLAAEVIGTPTIVVGRVLSETPLHEDTTDPDGYTAYNLQIRVLNRLKGNSPDLIVIRNENTSARYAMSVGEVHLLFVSAHDRVLWVNSCGNSSPMPAAEQLVQQVQAQLRSSK